VRDFSPAISFSESPTCAFAPFKGSTSFSCKAVRRRRPQVLAGQVLASAIFSNLSSFSNTGAMAISSF
jgi:hypothetical protein